MAITQTEAKPSFDTLDSSIKIGYYKDPYHEISFDNDNLNAVMTRWGTPLEEADIIFSTFHSAENILSDFSPVIDLMIVDECHRFHAGAINTNAIFSNIVNEDTVKIGLTGTLIGTNEFLEYF